jgi:hypothetical protein
MPPRTTLALGALLLASLALNVRLYQRKPTAPSVAPRPAGAEGRADCQQRLELCQRRGWDVLRKVIAAENTSPKPAPEPEPPSAPGAGPAEQDSALCETTKRGFRDAWRRERDDLAASILKNSADADQQEQDLASVLGKMRRVAELDDRQADLVARAYRERWHARWDEAREALQRDPQDFGGLADAARGLFADEDAILERIAGSAARDAWRTDQLVMRTEVIAITSATADRPLDASLHW